MTASHTPTVAIVGRPNVGKSTLFNRLVGKRRAITLKQPGVTRDPIAEEVCWDDQRLRLVDTGGIGGEREIELAARVHEHTLSSVRGADLVVALFDARAGLNPLDSDTVDLLSKVGVPTIFAANKVDGNKQENAPVEFCRLGIDVPLPISAEHNIGIRALRERILDELSALKAEAGSDLKKFQTGLYRILGSLVQEKYGVNPSEASEADLPVALRNAGLAEVRVEKIAGWLIRAQKAKYSPVEAAPGETIRLESEIRTFFEDT